MWLAVAKSREGQCVCLGYDDGVPFDFLIELGLTVGGDHRGHLPIRTPRG